MKVAELHEVIEKFKSEVLLEIHSIKESVKGIEEINNRVSDLETKVDKKLKLLEDRIDGLEGYTRRSNIIVHGLKEGDSESHESTEDKVRSLIKDDLDIQEEISIERCHRLGKRNGGRSRPVIVRFSFFKQKQLTMKRAPKLQGKAVSVSDDFTLAVRQRRKMLVPHLKYFRNKGKKASLTVDKLSVDGVTYIVNENNEVVNQKTGVKLQYQEN